MKGVEQACGEGIAGSGRSLAVASGKLQGGLKMTFVIVGAGGGSVFGVDGDALADAHGQQIASSF